MGGKKKRERSRTVAVYLLCTSYLKERSFRFYHSTVCAITSRKKTKFPTNYKVRENVQLREKEEYARAE